MIAFPNCKINLGLAVIEKRSDGYHNIETIFLPIALKDILEIIPSTSPSKIDITGDTALESSPDNLCLRAYNLLKAKFDLPPVHIHLHKSIPTGAGLGGGSANAAYTLTLCNQIFQLNLSNEELQVLAAQLGADCAFFIYNKAAFATQKGEILTPIYLNLSKYYITIIKPQISVSTAEAYAMIAPQKPSKSINSIISQPIETWKNELFNDFEIPVFKKHPIIKEIKDKLYELDAVYAAMSGSGAAVYGIFNEKKDLSSHFEGYFYWQGKL